MSLRKKSKKSSKLQENKDKFEKPVDQEDEEGNSFLLPEIKKKEIIKNGSPTSNYDATSLNVPGHSTPVRVEYCINDMEDTSEPDYRCSPILIPCTQDVSEVAWDWQSSIGKSSDKGKSEAEQTSTPKRTKLFQNKRNSNSPLLYKPIRKKLVKAENIESIGKFTAELKAITEKMKIIQRNNKDHCINEEDNKKDKVEDSVEEDPPKSNCASTFANKISTSLEELFDESIEDSMIRCSQEVEDKLNLCSTKGSSTENSSDESTTANLYGDNREELMRVNCGGNNLQYTSFYKNESSVNVCNLCKTCLKDTSLSIKTPYTNIQKKKEEIMKKPSEKNPSVNNNIVSTYNGNQQNQKNIAKHNSSDLFEIPDDSFDDCLATCIEDEKLLSQSTEYDDIFSDIDQNFYGKNYKQSNVVNKYGSKNLTKSYNYKPIDVSNRSIVNSATNVNITEGRKFFKTKSLSDSHFGPERNTNRKSKIGTPNSRQVTKYFSHSNLSSKPQVNSTTAKTTVNGSAYINKSVKSINPKESVYELSTSKIISKDSGCSMGKSSPTSGESQIMQCTPEEIEKKRLEAKLRLEAKRKLQTNSNRQTNISEIPVKRVQR